MNKLKYKKKNSRHTVTNWIKILGIIGIATSLAEFTLQGCLGHWDWALLTLAVLCIVMVIAVFSIEAG